jgi:hypothetical protein
MIGDTIDITYNTVSKTLTRVNPNGYSSEYYLDDKAGNDMVFNLSVKHTIPPRGSSGESHLARLDVEHYDSTSGEYTHTASAWMVIKTSDAPQVATDSDNAAQALVDAMSDTLIDQLIARES